MIFKPALLDLLPPPPHLMSPGSSKTQLWPTGGFLLRSSKSTWCYCGDQWPAVRAGTLVHKGEALQGHGEHYDDTQR